MLEYGPFAPKTDNPLFIQFSGGETSGFLACMAPDNATITYQNTGREDERTLVFIERVSEALKREIIWLEWRPPKMIGMAPNNFQWERVDFKTASRKGEPFVECMRAINAYRATKGEPPGAPWHRMRLCTTYLKHRVLDHYVRDQSITAHDRWIGMRSDEPSRVASLRGQETRDKGLHVPLYECGISKADIRIFWDKQEFQLGIPEFAGNCDGCFEKDQGDLARSLGNRPEAAAWWQAMQDEFPRFGGQNMMRYADLANELPTRLAIEQALRTDQEPVDDGRLAPRRYLNVVKQERRRIEEGSTPWSCSCESKTSDEV